VFDGLDENGMPAWGYPYNANGVGDVVDQSGDYADESATLENTRTVEWMHPLGETVTALIDAGLTIDFLHEHYEVPWRIFPSVVPTKDGLFGWPDRQWLPLAVSIAATRSA
jgi:hypothetical protein